MKLISPVAAATTKAEQQKSQLLSGLLLCYTFMMFAIFISQIVNPTSQTTDYRVLLGFITLNYGFTYLLSRTKYYRFAAIYFIAQMMLGIMSTGLTGNLLITIQSVVYFVFAIQLTCILLSNGLTLLVAILSTLATLLIGNINPQASMHDLAGISVYILGAGLFAFISASLQRGFVRRAEEAEQEAIKQKFEAEKSLKQIDSMLQSMDQGILVVDTDLNIEPNYSSFLETILDAKNLGGRSFKEVILNRSDIDREKSDMISSTLSNVIGESSLSFEINSHIFPRSFHMFINGSEKIIDASFSPIIVNDIVLKVLVVLRDVSEIESLRLKSKSQDEKLNKILRILKAKREDFLRFINSSIDLVQKSQQGISHIPNPDKIAQVFRNVHTIKGNARSFGFEDVSSLAHELEDILDKAKGGGASANEVDEYLGKLNDSIYSYQRLYHDEIIKLAA